MMSETRNFIVSIVVPVYNREKLIAETLDSLLSQTYQNWECIVVDDGSSDNTFTVLQEYSKRDNRIKAIERNRTPKGAPTCRNIGINSSNGEYLIFLDSDDLLGEDCLQFRTEQALSHPNKTALIFDTSIFQKAIYDDSRMWNELVTNEDDLIRFLKSDPSWSISGPLWKREGIRFFDETAIAAQDWEYHVRYLLSSQNYLKVSPSPKKTHLFCRRDDKLASISTRKKSNEENTAISRLTIDVISEVIESSGSSKVQREAAYALLKLAVQQKKRKQKSEALATWAKARESSEINKTEYFFWKVYILLYSKFTARILDFIVHRVFKKAAVLNNDNNMLK